MSVINIFKGNKNQEKNTTKDGFFQEFEGTISKAFSCKGIGVHSANDVIMKVIPELESTGIYFVRTDVKDSDNIIKASYENVTERNMSTVISNESGVSVSTIEHIMAALEGSSVHNARIEIDGPEVPIMDGSSLEFVNLINDSGVVVGNKKRKSIKLFKKIRVSSGESWASLSPSLTPMFNVHFDFHKRLPNSYEFSFSPSEDSFSEVISPARTLGFYEDAEKLWKMGLAKGSSIDNTVVIKDGKVANPEGLRFDDEMVRHKILDAIGDLSLLGVTVLANYEAYNGGHGLNNMLINELIKSEDSFAFM